MIAENTRNDFATCRYAEKFGWLGRRIMDLKLRLYRLCLFLSCNSVSVTQNCMFAAHSSSNELTKNILPQVMQLEQLHNRSMPYINYTTWCSFLCTPGRVLLFLIVKFCISKFRNSTFVNETLHGFFLAYFSLRVISTLHWWQAENNTEIMTKEDLVRVEGTWGG